MLNPLPVAGQFVTVKSSQTVELWQGQELIGPSGQVSIVRQDELVVRFEVVSDKSGSEYIDYATVTLEDVADVFEGFEWIEE